MSRGVDYCSIDEIEDPLCTQNPPIDQMHYKLNTQNTHRGAMQQ